MISRLMSFGDGVKVLAPQEVRDDLRRTLKAALSVYGEKE